MATKSAAPPFSLSYSVSLSKKKRNHHSLEKYMGVCMCVCVSVQYAYVHDVHKWGGRGSVIHGKERVCAGIQSYTWVLSSTPVRATRQLYDLGEAHNLSEPLICELRTSDNYKMINISGLLRIDIK